MKQILVPILIAASMLFTHSAKAQFTVSKDTATWDDYYVNYLPSHEMAGAFKAKYVGNKSTFDFNGIDIVVFQKKGGSNLSDFKFLKDAEISYYYLSASGPVYQNVPVSLQGGTGMYKEAILSLGSIKPIDSTLYFKLALKYEDGIDTFVDYTETMAFVTGNDGTTFTKSAATYGHKLYTERMFSVIPLGVPDRKEEKPDLAVELANFGITSTKAMETDQLQFTSNGKIGKNIASIKTARIVDNSNATIGQATYDGTQVTVYLNQKVFIAAGDTFKFKVWGDFYDVMPGDFMRMVCQAYGEIWPFATVKSMSYARTRVSQLSETVTYSPPTFVETPVRESFELMQTVARGSFDIQTKFPAVLVDMTGRIVKQIPASNMKQTIDVSNFASGMYVISAQGITQKISVAN